MSKNLSEHSKKITPPNLDAWNKQMYRVRVFDELIYDTDANLINALIGQCLAKFVAIFSRAWQLVRIMPQRCSSFRSGQKFGLHQS
jgi:hypothetical protein